LVVLNLARSASTAVVGTVVDGVFGEEIVTFARESSRRGSPGSRLQHALDLGRAWYHLRGWL